MRLRDLIAEAVRSTVARKAPASLILGVSAVLCLTIILTVGRTAAAQQEVKDRIEQSSSRLLTLTDSEQKGYLTSDWLSSVSEYSSVEATFGTSAPIDVTNGALRDAGAKTPLWRASRELEDSLTLVHGRFPDDGEVMISELSSDKLGIPDGVG